MNGVEQLTSGLYGGIVVLEPGKRLDPRRDHIFVAGWDSDAEPIHLQVNGDSLPPPLRLRRDCDAALVPKRDEIRRRRDALVASRG